jgi:LysM repeat protein
MADQPSIFGNQNSEATPPNTGDTGNGTNAPNVDPVADLLGSIKNERGEPKYKNIQDALVALRHSQEYIPQLTTQLSQKDSELNTARAEAARINELERSLQALTQSREQPASTRAPEFSEERIAELVNQSLTRKQTEDLQRANVSKVVQDMVKQYGPDAQKTYEAKAAEFGMTVAQLNQLASSTPQAVLNLMGVNKATQPREQTPATQFNSEAFQPLENSFIGKNPKPVMIGATTQDIRDESVRSQKMIEELHAQGKTVYDLTDPKVYFKMFK